MNIEQPSQKILKTRLRKELRQRRAGIDSEQRRQWDERINQALLERTAMTRPGIVAAYLSFDGEPDLSHALEAMGARGVTVALPVIHDLPGKSAIEFHAWKPGSELGSNRYGISEPVNTVLVPVTEIDLVLLPLVGWDRNGGRLGMGASFYDRLFQPFAELAKPERVGVAYELQRADSIPCDPWDIRLHGVLSENGWFTCGD